MENFAVKSNSFALYEAFKKDVEAIGWKYNENFTPFSKEQSEYNNCLFFADKWDGEQFPCSFSLSNSSSDVLVFSLETQQGEALAFVKKTYGISEVDKEPIVGEMAIFWDNVEEESIIAIYSEYEHEFKDEYPHEANDGTTYRNAILYESPEQYKAFLKS